jgi:hypothetical protein
MIDCYRALGENTPFINVDQELSLEVHRTQKGGFRGVRFSTKPDNISPHISRTHCESSLHVLCRPIASSLADVVAAKPELNVIMPGLSIKAEPANCAEVGYTLEEKEDDEKIFRFENDSYTIYSDRPVEHSSFQADRIVTKETVRTAVHRATGGATSQRVKVILIDLVGEEECMKGWAFLSNEATEYLVNELEVEVIVLNTPSIDRESDGGLVPNHKAVFSKKHNLVVELARLSHLGEGFGDVLLDIEPHNTYADCGACRVEFRPHDAAN